MSMSHCWLAAVFAAVVSVLPAQDQGKPAPRPVAPGGLVVGIVDLGKAFDLYPRTIKERERLQKIADSSRDQVDKVTKRIEELRAMIPMLKEGAIERETKQLDLEIAMREREGLAKLLNDQLQLETMRMQLAIYEDVEAAITRLAKDRGVHVVLRTDQKDTAPPETGDKTHPKAVQGRVFAFERRQVWFAAEELDLTSDLIKLLQVWPLETGNGAPATPPAGRGATGGTGGGE